MKIASDLRSFTSLAIGLRSFLRTRVTLESARATIRARRTVREANFLATVERAIFSHPKSPYRPLLALSGCEFGDIARLVRADGIEATLHSLRASGIYFSFEEFKGRQPVIRGSHTFAVSPADFTNPHITPQYWAGTGGSTGPRSRIGGSFHRSAANYMTIAHHAYGVDRAPKAVWHAMLPAMAGLHSMLSSVTMGNIPRRWFTPLVPSDLTSSRKYPLATYSIILLARAYGARIPWPEPVAVENAHIVARWAAESIKAEGNCHVATTASLALRVCAAARHAGLDLTGATFSGGGEPMTEAKAAGIAAAGARCRPGYFATEAGAIGMSCANPIDANDQHLLDDSIAIVQYPRIVPGTRQSVDAFNVTTILPTASPVLLNVELDDYGVIEKRVCGCPFEALGFARHVRHIRSFRKLTGEGVSLVGSDMARVIEEVLPETFGGTPLDYQLCEEEDAHGFTRLTVVVSPAVNLTSEQHVIDTVLSALTQSGAGADYARATWKRAQSLRVARRMPNWTAQGKLMPLQASVRRSRAKVETTETAGDRT